MIVLYAISQVGVTLYMFLIGLEFDSHLLLGRGKHAGIISASGILVPFLLGGALALWIMPQGRLFGATISPWMAALFLFTKKPAAPQAALSPAPQQNTKADILKARLEHQREIATLKAQQEKDRRAEQQTLRTAQRAAMQAGVQRLTRRAVSAWRHHKQVKADALLAPDTFKVEVDTLDNIEKGKLHFSPRCHVSGRIPADDCGGLVGGLFLRWQEGLHGQQSGCLSCLPGQLCAGRYLYWFDVHRRHQPQA